MASIYRLILHLLPAELRRKHGAAMEALFVREFELARSRGPFYLIAAAASAIWDVVHRSAYEIARMKNNSMEPPHMSLPTTRELLRRHALSFAVAFVTLTVFLLLPFGSRQLASLRANGASAGTIAEVLLLALPFTAAMTIPMAVLLSVLYEFTRLGAKGTLAAARQMRDGVRRLMVPVLVAAVGVTALAFVVTAELVPRTNERLASVLAGHTVPPGDRSMTLGALREAARNAEKSVEAADISRATSYQVEFQKKLALPAACLILAFAGMTIAFRIPRGGFGIVMVTGVALFGAYYGLIMTGETLADRMVISPFVAMWSANAFVLTVALLAAYRRKSVASMGQGTVASL